MGGLASREERRGDRRSRRTQRTLEEALVGLMLEKRYDTITVQEIIDRANVGRSTFYAHYMDKEDLLQSEVVRLADVMVGHMDRSAVGNRIIPSLELLRHLRDSQDLIRALVRGRAIDPVLKTMQAQFSLHVESRLALRLPPGTTLLVPLPVVAHHLVGALLVLFQWWLDREMPELPEQIDAYYLELVGPSVRAATGIEL